MKDTSTQARQLIMTTTSVIVLVTVLFNGGLTTNTIKLLKIRRRKAPTEGDDDYIPNNDWKNWKRFNKK